jgi:hypothetical protein
MIDRILTCACRNLTPVLFGGWGSKLAPVVAVAALARERRRGARGRTTQGRGGGNDSVSLSIGPEEDKRNAWEDAQAVRTNAFLIQI